MPFVLLSAAALIVLVWFGVEQKNFGMENILEPIELLPNQKYDFELAVKPSSDIGATFQSLSKVIEFSSHPELVRKNVKIPLDPSRMSIGSTLVDLYKFTGTFSNQYAQNFSPGDSMAALADVGAAFSRASRI